MVVEIGARSPRIVEDWSMEITDFRRNPFTARYKITGSVTGYDGEGSNWEDFISNSGRVVMTAADWLQIHYYWSALGGELTCDLDQTLRGVFDPAPTHRGKVRDVFERGDELLLVATFLRRPPPELEVLPLSA